MDTIEIYREMIDGRRTPSGWRQRDWSPGRLERHIKALFGATDIVYVCKYTMPTICRAILTSNVEMTQKYYTLARRGANGDTRWMYDSYGYARVQLMEFRERYVDRDSLDQFNAMIEFWLDTITEYYKGDNLTVFPEDQRRVVKLVDSQVNEWLEQQHALAIEQDKEEEEKRKKKEEERERLRLKAHAKLEARNRQAERNRKHQEKKEYMMSLMS